MMPGWNTGGTKPFCDPISAEQIRVAGAVEDQRAVADASAQHSAGSPQSGVAGGGQIRIGGDEQLLLSLSARIVEERGERGVPLFGDTQGYGLALAIHPVLPLLLQATEGGRVLLAEQRDVLGFGQGEEFDVHCGFGLGLT